jgi:dTDP-4-dehydrorhamnose reductase
MKNAEVGVHPIASVPEPVILVTGSTGQVGFELLRSLQGLGRVVSADRSMLELANFDQIRAVVRELRPTLIINSAAYTAVDRAESDEAAAMRVNGEAVGVLAEAANAIGAALIHYSTDYVFDGAKEGAYDEADATNPLSVYGRSKLAGERAIEQLGGRFLVLRTSWVYSGHGRNFLRTMLRLATERKELAVVADQIGAPTWAVTIAAMTAHIAGRTLVGPKADSEWWSEHSGIYHLTASGSTSWAGFATAIFQSVALAAPPLVRPIASEEYITPAVRPRNSRLSNTKLHTTFGLRAPEWKDALSNCILSMARL